MARILRALEAAAKPDDLDMPGYFFHALGSGTKAGFPSVSQATGESLSAVPSPDAVDVDLEDYH